MISSGRNLNFRMMSSLFCRALPAHSCCPACWYKSSARCIWATDLCPCSTLKYIMARLKCPPAESGCNSSALCADSSARSHCSSRMNAELSSAEVIYQFMEEFVESVDRLQGMLTAAERASQ